MGRWPSPYRESGVNIKSVLKMGQKENPDRVIKTQKKTALKKPVFPNQHFVSQNAYYEFCDKHQVWGKEALDLKRKMDKEESIIPMPTMRIPKKKDLESYEP